MSGDTQSETEFRADFGLGDAKPKVGDRIAASPPGPHYHKQMVQGSDEWHAARCGLLTASEMKLIVMPTLKPAANDKERTHLYELMAQRISRYVEPSYISDDMLRGQNDEAEAVRLYEQRNGPVQRVGFVTNNRWGFTLGYSPDALVGQNGLVEAKSRRQKYQIQTIVEHLGVAGGTTIPADYVIQCQTGLLVSEREWIDFVSFSGGLPMAVVRVWPDEQVQAAIIDAATGFEARLAEKMAIYHTAVEGLIETERTVEQEMYA